MVTTDSGVLTRLETIESLLRNQSLEDEFRDVKTLVRDQKSRLQEIRSDLMELQQVILQTGAD